VRGELPGERKARNVLDESISFGIDNNQPNQGYLINQRKRKRAKKEKREKRNKRKSEKKIELRNRK
jgi:hypothetical protein